MNTMEDRRIVLADKLSLNKIFKFKCRLKTKLPFLGIGKS